jgi:hypothetical protein
MPDRPFFPQVVVKVVDSIPIEIGQGNGADPRELAAMITPFVGPIAAAAVLSLDAFFPDFDFRRLFDPVTAEEIAEMVGRAREQDPSYQPPRFDNFLNVICPVGFDPQFLVATLAQMQGIVELAYVMPRTEPAGVVAVTNPKFGLQRYLLPAPIGIGVQSAWLKGADGTNGQLIDIEHAWLLNRDFDDRHEDLPVNIPLLAGVNRRESRGHGAAVLGVIAALDNNVGVVGIAPRARVRVMSSDEPSPPAGVDPLLFLAARILAAGLQLRFGDVVLLESTVGGGLPMELDPAVFKSIELIAKAGIVVVEAAGNAGLDLDGQGLLGDSCAILVGACLEALPHRRVPNPDGSNFGVRVDCKAWGEHVHTCGSRDPVTFNSYFDFSGTSAAAAIVAGLCLLVQQLHEQKHGLPMHGLTLRDVLRNPNNCTVSPTASIDRIGHMPDLQKIITNLAL